MPNSFTTATYWIETPDRVEIAAEMLAGEQSCGTFVKVPLENESLRALHAARIHKIEELEPSTQPSLPNAQRDWSRCDTFRRARVEIQFPYLNTGPSIEALFTQLAGNLFELSCFSGIRLLDFQPCSAFEEAYQGPKFGVGETRGIAGVTDRPIIGTIIKPSVGLSPRDTAEFVYQLAQAGLDFIKDDELIANPPYSPVRKRVRAVMERLNSVRNKTGRRVLYACNITDSTDAMLRHHDAVLEAGGNCIMINLNAIGLAAADRLARHSQLPIHGHRAGWGALSRHPGLGFSYVAWQKFWRMIGVDHLHVNGIRNKFCESDESVVASALACSNPLLQCAPCMPVFSSGQWAEQVWDTFRLLGSPDLLYLCGGGIAGHPDGIEAGVRSIREAWNAALNHESLETARMKHPALNRSYAFFNHEKI